MVLFFFNVSLRISAIKVLGFYKRSTSSSFSMKASTRNNATKRMENLGNFSPHTSNHSIADDGRWMPFVALFAMPSSPTTVYIQQQLLSKRSDVVITAFHLFSPSPTPNFKLSQPLTIRPPLSTATVKMAFANRTVANSTKPSGRRLQDGAYTGKTAMEVGCWKFSLTYTNGAGGIPTGCDDGYTFSSGLCYPNCDDGYYAVGPVCWQGCGSGY